MPAQFSTLAADTLVLHGGSLPARPGDFATTVPIYQSTSFDFPDTATAKKIVNFEQVRVRLFAGREPNGRRVRAAAGRARRRCRGARRRLRPGRDSAWRADVVEAGDNIVSSPDLYGGTVHFFKERLKQFGIEARFVDPSDPQNFRGATDDRTRLYSDGALPNPKLSVFPIAEVAAIGRPLGIPLIVDNTAAPLAIKPFDHGAAVVVYSATKYIGGHGTTIGGAVVDSGNFPWAEFPGASR